jgi:rhodanese-related sulfurtransferase
MIETNDDLILVDVREFDEYCDPFIGHISGALLYPFSSGALLSRYEELPIDGEILVYCRSGNRSNSASSFLDSQGFEHVYDMLGGIQAWAWETVDCVDTDGDGANDDLDNCPGTFNPSQTDSDDDRMGNACDPNCPNLDGVNPVGFFDYSILLSNWKLSGTGLYGDLNNDGIVDELDLLILANYWLSECYE